MGCHGRSAPTAEPSRTTCIAVPSQDVELIHGLKAVTDCVVLRHIRSVPFVVDPPGTRRVYPWAVAPPP